MEPAMTDFFTMHRELFLTCPLGDDPKLVRELSMRRFVGSAALPFT